MKRISNSIFQTSLVFCFVSGAFADPHTDYMFDRINKYQFMNQIEKYYSKKYVSEVGSLPSVSSMFDKASGRVHGAGFVIDMSEFSDKLKNVLITNAHLLQGNKKKITLDMVNFDQVEETIDVEIDDKDAYFCADKDIALINLNPYEADVRIRAFGKYDPYKRQMSTIGVNNSPRGYYLMDEFGIGGRDDEDRLVWKNENKRPLFFNELTGEMLHFYQMGNMFDLSCNYFPSSPETYDGNAIFIPVTTRRKNNFNNPIPFVQKIFNQPNSFYAHMARTKSNECRIDLTGELKAEERVKWSYLTNKLNVPAGIVPGMSGSPLVINEDLRQKFYRIAGMVTTYDRRMQQSHFIDQKHILECVEKMATGKTQKDNVEFKYSSEFATFYRSSKNFVEIPNESLNAGSLFGGDGAAGNGGDGAAGNGGDGAAGNGGDCFSGDGAAGNGGDGAAGNGGCLFNTTKPIKFGVKYNGEHVLGFRCHINDKNYNILANWEAKELVASEKCSPIRYVDDILMVNLLKEKLKKLHKRKAKNNNLHSLKLNARFLEKRNELVLEIKGEYYLKELDDEISFKKRIVLNEDLKNFNPYKELKIEEDDITNFLNDYEGGETLILDLSELYFVDMNRVYTSKNKKLSEIMMENNIPRIHGSLRYKNNSKGSIPIMLEWK